MAAIRTSIGPCLTQAEASRASTARSAIGTADTGFTTSRPTGPSSTAPNTGSTRRTSCGTEIAWASGPTSSPFPSKRDESRKILPRRPRPAFDAGLADVWGPVGEAAAPETAARRQAAQTRDAPADFLDFASFLEAPKAAPGADRGPAAIRGRLADCGQLRSVASAGAQRSGAPQTGAGAAGGRRPAARRHRQSPRRPGRRRPTPPRRARFSIASLGRPAFPSMFSLPAIRTKSPTRSARLFG